MVGCDGDGSAECGVAQGWTSWRRILVLSPPRPQRQQPQSKDGGAGREGDKVAIQSEDQAAEGGGVGAEGGDVSKGVWEVGMGREGK